MEVVRKFGVIRGSIMGGIRILRCSSRFLGGPDPVPDHWSFKQIRSDWIAYRKPRD